jgi:hypothetical protein
VTLGLTVTKYQENNNQKAIEKLLKISPIAHLLGHYTFCSNKHPIDLDEMVVNLDEEWK